MRQESFSSLLFYIVQGALTSTIKQEKNKSSRIGKKEPKHLSLVDNVIVYIGSLKWSTYKPDKPLGVVRQFLKCHRDIRSTQKDELYFYIPEKRVVVK